MAAGGFLCLAREDLIARIVGFSLIMNIPQRDYLFQGQITYLPYLPDDHVKYICQDLKLQSYVVSPLL